MSTTALRIEGLSKCYRLRNRSAPTMLREALSGVLLGPVRRLLGQRSSARVQSDSQFWALRDVGFTVGVGEALGIIGRNGSGKSTLLKVLSRITEPSSGFADITGRVGCLLEVGTGFHPELSGRENVFLNGATLGMRRHEIQRKFDEIVAFAEIGQFLDMPVKHYSSGMYTRLAFSVAAHLESEILLVDEVLAVGDAEFQKRCLGKMDEAAGAGRTVLFVSHNMPTVQRLCRRGLLLEGGRLVADGPIHTVVERYLQSGTQDDGERLWPDPAGAPGNDVVRLRAVRARNAQGEVSSRLLIHEPFTVEIEFWVLQPGQRLDAGLHFTSETGGLACMTGDFQDPRWYEAPRPVGLHRSTCHVPANLFNEGSFSLFTWIAPRSGRQYVKEPDVLVLRLVDDWRAVGARGNYTRPWPGGLFRPLLPWSFDFTPADENASAA